MFLMGLSGFSKRVITVKTRVMKIYVFTIKPVLYDTWCEDIKKEGI